MSKLPEREIGGLSASIGLLLILGAFLGNVACGVAFIGFMIDYCFAEYLFYLREQKPLLDKSDKDVTN